MMKRLIYLTTVALACASCNDFLDVMPDNRTELNTEESLKKLLVTAYPEYTHLFLAEYSSDNIDENKRTFSYMNKLEEEVYNWEVPYEENQDSPLGVWNSCYSCIAQTNYALRGIESTENPSALSAYKGEALLCRAYSAFMLATTFCKPYDHETADTDLGLPYPTEPETTVNPTYTRGTLAELYGKIEADIEAGLPLISDDAYDVPKYHFNRKAAYAFAARFYLYYMQPDRSNLEKTIRYATEALGSNASASLRDWLALGKLSPNDNVQTNAYADANEPANLLLQSAVSWLGVLVDPGWGGTGERYAHNALTAKEDCQSIGLWGGYTSFYQQPFQPGSGNPKIGFRRITMFQKMSESGDSYLGYAVIPLFTTDETLITRAEAHALLGHYDEAAADISTWQKNFSINKADVTPQDIHDFYGSLAYYQPDAPTVKKELHPVGFTLEPEQEDFIHCILHIRRILTLGEGMRWQDVRRYGIPIYRRYVEDGVFIETTDMLPPDDLRRTIQLPRTIISSGMEPNPR